MAFSFVTKAADSISGSISKNVNSLGNVLNSNDTTAQNEYSNFEEGVDWQDFDLENPDGVHIKLRANNLNKLTSDANLANQDSIASNSQNQTNLDSSKNFVNNIYNNEIESVSYKVDGEDVNVGKKPFSYFNNFSLIDYRANVLKDIGGKNGETQINGTDSIYSRVDPQVIQNPTASKIVELSKDIKGYQYDYGDFALARYFNKIPNNMMITLRRFAFPAPDDIISPKTTAKDGSALGVEQPPIAKAITYLGETPGNKLEDIVKFNHGFNWKEAEAQVQELQSQRGKQSGKVGSFINNSSLLSSLANSAQGKDAYESALDRANAGFDAFSNTYPNHVFGPLNVIKQVMVRDQGLKFNQEFTLKFEYQLKSLGGANPKILMMDQLANLLALTYNNAPFWGGDVRYINDGSVAKPLGDAEKLRSGDYGGYLKGIVNDLSGSANDFMDNVGDLFNGSDSKFLNNILGGGLQELFNSPQGGQAVASLLTGDPTGQWHLTVGNPLNPIMVIGNLICTDTNINFEGAMGVQDFPEKLVMTISLKPGRPRDKGEIETMFNAGRGRFYIQPSDSININDTQNNSAYGNKDRVKYMKDNQEYKKIGLG